MRHENWPVLLANFLEMRRALPFAWGSNDCCAFAAAWVLEATGRDLFAPWAGYTTAAEALRHVQDAGGMRALWDGLMSAPAWPPGAACAPTMARRGDLLLVEVEGRESVAVVDGVRAAGPGREGLVWVPTRSGVCAWQV